MLSERKGGYVKVPSVLGSYPVKLKNKEIGERVKSFLLDELRAEDFLKRNPGTLVLLLRAADRYSVGIAYHSEFRVKDIRSLNSNLQKNRKEFLKFGQKLVRMQEAKNDLLSSMYSGVTEHKLIIAIEKLDEFISRSTEFEKSVVERYGTNDSGPIPVSRKMREEPLDVFMMHLAALWVCEGRSLYGGEGKKFVELVCRFIETISGKVTNHVPNENERMRKLRISIKKYHL